MVKLFDDNISPIKVLTLLYALIMSSILLDKVNRHLVEAVNKYAVLKHMLIITTIIVILTHIYSDVDMATLIVYSLLIYFLFILSTKTSMIMNVFVASSLFALYLLTYQWDREKKKIEMQSDGYYDEKLNKINEINKRNKYATIGLIGLVVFSALLYDNKKYKQHGGNYSLLRFIS